ncbi:hypothetical protein H2200_004988 [Cladophialophora chaetospira]|uniref:Uncharacterized protein n=1 Tax=Cladophialophora chaetospira TaxID=386627 RepID=A0AA38XBQ7_9EURO|nr:hypothetical protein H2200_004988 [Cladophialophora chaetospira]
MDSHNCSETARRFSVAQDGDVILKVGSGTQAFDIIVAGAVISRASDVLSKMLSSQKSTTQVIHMPDDFPKAVLMFSCATHNQLDSYRKLLDFEVRGLIAFADKYKCQKTLEPYLQETLSDYGQLIDRCTEDLDKSHPVPVLPHMYSDLRLDDIIALAVVFQVETLFTQATELYFVLGKGPLEPNEYEKKLATLWLGDLHLFEALERNRLNEIANLKTWTEDMLEETFDKGRHCMSAQAVLDKCKSHLERVFGKATDKDFPESWREKFDAIVKALVSEAEAYDVRSCQRQGSNCCSMIQLELCQAFDSIEDVRLEIEPLGA